MPGMLVRCYPRCCLRMLSALTPKGKAATPLTGGAGSRSAPASFVLADEPGRHVGFVDALARRMLGLNSEFAFDSVD